MPFSQQASQSQPVAASALNSKGQLKAGPILADQQANEQGGRSAWRDALRILTFIQYTRSIMAKHRVRATNRRPGWNRGDLAILLCGILGFFSLTFGAPLLQHGEAAAPAGPVHSSRPTTYTWPLSAVVTGRATGTTRSFGPVAPAPTAVPAAAASNAAQSAPAASAPAGPVLPAASAPRHIRYPAAAIDTAIHPLEPDQSAVASQTIVPPTTMDGYWLTPFGTPGNGSNNTTYIIGHSWEGRDAPFNHLSSDASVGDEFTITTTDGTLRYRVDSVTTYLKSTLKDSPIWDIVPNRVVLISCYTEDPWGKNVAVSASPAD